MAEVDVAAALEWQFHFDPATYAEMIHEDIPVYDRFQEELARGERRTAPAGCWSWGPGPGRRRGACWSVTRTRCWSASTRATRCSARRGGRSRRGGCRFRWGGSRTRSRTGPFDLVASALCVHHLRGSLKRDLFARVRARLAPGGRFVLGDVVVPADPADAVIPL